MSSAELTEWQQYYAWREVEMERQRAEAEFEAKREAKVRALQQWASEG
jgi:hypothetical protein